MSAASKSRIDRTQAEADLLSMLSDAARTRSTVTYRDVAVQVFGGRVPARSRLIMDLLGEVDERFFAEHGVVIASLVVRADSGIPGVGYFRFLASHFGRDVSDPERAWREEAERVWLLFERGPHADR